MRTLLLFAAVLAAVLALGLLLHGLGASPEFVPESATSDPQAAAPRRAERKRAVPEETLEEPAEEIPPPVGEPRTPAPRVAVRFSVPGHEDLEKRDWKKVAEAVRDFAAATRQMAERPAEVPASRGPGDEGLAPPPTPEEEKLAALGQRFQQTALSDPDGGPEAKTPLNHPAFGANLVAALLDLANMPLTDAQAKRLSDLALERSALVDATVPHQLPDDGSYRLEHILAHAQALDGFYAEVWSVLTPAQVEVVSPEKWRGRFRVDMLSSGWSWPAVVHPLAYSDAEQLTGIVTRGLGNRFSVPQRMEELRPIVAAWVADLPYDPPDVMELRGHFRNARAYRDARRMVDLLRRVTEGMKLPKESVEQARRVPNAYMPFLRR